MIVLDTNVLSEPLRLDPSPNVMAWWRGVGSNGAVTSVAVAELFYGAWRLPKGKRRTNLLERVEQLVREAGHRLLTFDNAASRTYGELRAERERHGRAITTEDAMIAAICRSRGYALATRNIRDFNGLGIELINPWSVNT